MLVQTQEGGPDPSLRGIPPMEWEVLEGMKVQPTVTDNENAPVFVPPRRLLGS